MSRAARVKFSTEDFTQQVKSPNDGISFVLGRSVRGPFADPSDIINSWPSFVEIYGGLTDVSDAPLLARRILEKGGSIRFSRVGHYTDPTDAATLDAVKASVSPSILFEIDDPFLIDNEIDITLNGEDISIPFNTDSNTTYADLAAALQALDSVKVASVVSNGGDATDMYVVPAKGVTLDMSSVTITGGASQPTDSQTDVTSIVDESTGNILFDLVLKNEGEDGNNFTVEIGEPSNGDSVYFKITITNSAESIIETYDNLTIDENTTGGQATFLSDIIDGSSYMDVVYKDLSNYNTQLVPRIGTYLTFIGGSDGTDPVSADYIGDASQRNGFHAFDDYDEAFEMAALDNDSDAVNVGGAAYATNRADLQYFVHLPISLKTKAAILAKKASLGINTKYAYVVSGGIKIFDPITGQKVDKSEIGDVIALASKAAQEFGPWYSFAGLNRGLLTNGVIGVVNNFGTPATYNDLNDLANRQINMVVTKNGESVLWGNHSAQLANNIQSFNNVVRLVIFLKKALKPTLETFLEEPNDIPTWRRMYYTVKPLLDSLLNSRAFYNYEWLGDQDASSMDNLLINNSSDVSDGKYKINLVISPISAINEIEVAIILTKAGVTFEEVSGLS